MAAGLVIPAFRVHAIVVRPVGPVNDYGRPPGHAIKFLA